MAVEMRHFQVTIPAGTAVAAPVAVACTMPPRTVTRIDWRVPAGPMGVMGWWVGMGGVQIQPVPPSGPVIANGETGTWLIEDAPDGGTWQVIGYNTGANNHSIYLVFWTNPIAPRPSPVLILPPSDLMPAPDLSMSGPPLTGAR